MEGQNESESNENASVDVVSDLPYSYSHSLIVNLPGVSTIAGQNHFRFKLVHIAACYSCICTGEYVWKKLEISKTNYFCCYCYFSLLASGLREIQDGERTGRHWITDKFFTFVCNLVFWVRTQFKHYGIFGVQIFLITKNVFGRQTSVVYLGRRTFKNLYV